MSDNKTLIGDVRDLQNGGQGLTFSVLENEVPVPAFAVRYQDTVHAYKNRCGHIALNLDMRQGHFFTDEGDHLVCATHGAIYQPDTGKCAGGPCFGVGLEPIDVEEKDGVLYLSDPLLALAE